jgi:uncharacterized protein DUF5977
MPQPESLQYTDGYWVAGIDSFSQPDKLGPGELVASMNTTCRGGVVQTRPGSATLLSIPGENIQGFTLFTPASGVPHQVIAIDGYVYVSAAPFAEYRRLPNIRFSITSRFVVFESCLKSTDYTADGELIFISKPYNVLLMQDGVTRAAFWDGSTSRHLNPTPGTLEDSNGEHITQVGLDETYIGLWMKWSGNRLWVSRAGMLFASDIGNPLKFTEAQYINEGRAFYLPGDCTGMIETPEQDGLIVFTIENGTLFQTSIQDRTQWLSTPNFQKVVFSNIGCAAPLSLVKQYGLIWWFSPMGLINSDQAFSLNRSSRIDIQDNEMMCSKGNIGPDISGICACSYENYLLCSVPSGDVYNRHTWCLDQAVFEGPLNAWNSYWTGWRPVQWAVGNVNGVQRVFFASKDYNGCLKIWEANLPDRKDNGSPITCFAQFRQNDFGRPNQLKRFTYAELNLQEILGDVSVMVAVGGRKGGYTRVLTKEIAATEGAIYGDTIYDINSCMYGHRPQTRIIRTQENVEPTRCNKGGIEGLQPNDVDLTFGLLVAWSGRMGVAGYLAQSVVYEDQAAGNCEDDEVNPNSLSEQGCADKNYFINTCAFPIINGSGSAEAYCERSRENISAVATATSIISQADADRKAYFAAYIEAEQQCRNCVSTVYLNTVQRYTAACPSGGTYTATVAAGTYSSTISQPDANQQALAAATTLALENLGCFTFEIFVNGEWEGIEPSSFGSYGEYSAETGDQILQFRVVAWAGGPLEASLTFSGSSQLTLPVQPVAISVGPNESYTGSLILNTDDEADETGYFTVTTQAGDYQFNVGASVIAMTPPDALPGLDLWIDSSQYSGLIDGQVVNGGDITTQRPVSGPIFMGGITWKENAIGDMPALRMNGSASYIKPDFFALIKDLFIVSRVRTTEFSNDFLFQHGTFGPNGNEISATTGTQWILTQLPIGGYSINGVTSLTGESGIPDIQIYRAKLDLSIIFPQDIVIGSNYPYNRGADMDVMEVCGYNGGHLSDEDAGKLMAYFRNKWGIPNP